MELEDTLRRRGCEVVGPAATLEEALRLAEAGRIDAAVLDVNLGDGDVTPVLESLRARKVGVVVYTGSAGLPSGVGDRHPDIVVLQKPVQPGRLVGEIQRACRSLHA
jgi:DNA-binding NtrC family response regulator